MSALREPFDKTHTKTVKGIDFTYVGWSQVADRLDEAAPFDWSFAIVQVGDDWCWGRLTIGTQTFENIGYAENAEAEWKKEALKDAVSDAFKRCAALAGVARYLYDKDSPTGAAASSPRPAPRPAAVVLPVAGPASPPDEVPWPMESDPGPSQAARLDASSGGQCPDHHKDWKNGKFGWFCSTKTDDGWCRKTPSAKWKAAQEMTA